MIRTALCYKFTERYSEWPSVLHEEGRKLITIGSTLRNVFNVCVSQCNLYDVKCIFILLLSLKCVLLFLLRSSRLGISIIFFPWIKHVGLETLCLSNIQSLVNVYFPFIKHLLVIVKHLLWNIILHCFPVRLLGRTSIHI